LLLAAVLAAAALECGKHAGSGFYDATNDIAVPWPPAGSPLVVAVYFTQYRNDAKPRDDVVGSAARTVANAFG
jgi:beta-lactamase class A